MSARDEALDRFRQAGDLSYDDLFVRYFALGGSSTELELEAFCYGALEPSDHNYDVIAQALNERFLELGGDHPVPYAAVT